MLEIVIGFLGVSLLLYCVLGGADFGAGALECFMKGANHKRHEELVAKAMGPVWEANHIWLIILIVILFNGFPTVYTEYSIYFHIPLMIMLFGIVFRGCAFTFRHYDAVQDKTHRYYSLAFSFSSLLTPIMFGMIIGGMLSGVDPQATTYYQKYIHPWFNLFSFSIGIFVLSIFSYLASVYLIGETTDPAVQKHYITLTKITNIILLSAGASVFILAETSGHHLFRSFFTHPLSIICFILATLLTIIFWWKILNHQISLWLLRLIAGAQITFVLLAWFAMIFPHVLFYTNGTTLSLYDAAAPPITITILAWALMIGSLIFLPVLFYLIRVFKT